MKRKVCGCLVLGLLVLSLVGCASDREDVKLANEKEIVRYAEHIYGAAKVIETNSEDERVTVTLQDQEYGFQYEVSSCVRNLGIDGSTFGYTEAKESNFDEKYRKEIFSRLDSDSSLKVTEYEIVLYADSEEEIPAKAKAVAYEVGSLDTRGYLKEEQISVYDPAENHYFGSFDLGTGSYMPYADEMISQMTAVLSSYIRAENGQDQEDAEKAEFISYEQKKISEIPGLSDYELVNEKLTEDDEVFVYYFRYHGREYFVAKVKVWNIGDEYYSDFRHQ